MKRFSVLSVLLALCGVAGAEITTGWQAGLASGSYSWQDEANWVDGVANGVFSSGVVVSGKTYPTVTLADDVVLDTPLTFEYSNAEAFLYLKGNGANHSITTPGIFTQLSGNAAKGAITFGQYGANVDVDILFTKPAAAELNNYGFTTYCLLQNDFEVTGSMGSYAAVTLAGDNGRVSEGSSVRVSPYKGFGISAKDKGVTGGRRVDDLRLESGVLVYEGNAGANTEDTIGRLTLAPGAGASGNCRFQNWGTTSCKNAHLVIGELVREKNAIWDMHNYNSLIGRGMVGDAGSVNITVDGGVATVGTGEFGTPTAPIVPWAFMNNDSGINPTSESRFSSLVTYEEGRGFRPLSNDEYETISPGAGTTTNIVIESTGANLRVQSGTVAIDGDVTVNTLTMLSSSGVNLYITNGTTRILAGVLDLSAWGGAMLSANVDFGDCPVSYVTQLNNKTMNAYGTIHSDGDVVFGDQYLRNTWGNAPLFLHSKCDIAGDIYVNGGLAVSEGDTLADGPEHGDVYVYGRLRISTNNCRINGLNGTGNIVFSNSFTTQFSVGGNDANGDFDGSLQFTNGNPTLVKTGKGTQRFGGEFSTRALVRVNEGTLLLDGEASGTSLVVADGAALGGRGTVAQPVTAEGAMTLAVQNDRRTLCALTLNGGLTVPSVGSVTVEVPKGVTWPGKQCVLRSSTSMEGITFKRGEGVTKLSLSDDGLELYAQQTLPLVILLK